MDNGYVLLHRKLFTNRLWLSEKFTKAQAWIDLFSNANHENGCFWVRGIRVDIKRGQLGWSEQTMAQRWRWSRDKVRRFLSYLNDESQISIETIHQKMKLKSIITILNYDLYQKPYIKQDNKKTSNKTTNKTGTKNDKEEIKKDNTGIVEIIDSFKVINPAYLKWYGNKTQRSAIERMLSIHGRDRLLEVISFLPKSNTIPYVPTITSPYMLEEKWADLEASMVKLKNRSAVNSYKVIT